MILYWGGKNWVDSGGTAYKKRDAPQKPKYPVVGKRVLVVTETGKTKEICRQIAVLHRNDSEGEPLYFFGMQTGKDTKLKESQILYLEEKI